MSADKRTVSTDALETLGMIHTREEKRDAIHLAVLPVTAGQNLCAGDHVRIDREGLAVKHYEGDSETPAIGIVDPFLPRMDDFRYGEVKPGQRFWLVIYPRVITSLRHVWTHPDIPEETANLQRQVDDAREESRKWLEGFAERLFSYQPEYGTRFETLMSGAEAGRFGTDIEYGPDCTPNAEFWMHYERYTGKKVSDKPEYFSCSC